MGAGGPLPGGPSKGSPPPGGPLLGGPPPGPPGGLMNEPAGGLPLMYLCGSGIPHPCGLSHPNGTCVVRPVLPNYPRLAGLAGLVLLPDIVLHRLGLCDL
jgi:hypothetical protein